MMRVSTRPYDIVIYLD